MLPTHDSSGNRTHDHIVMNDALYHSAILPKIFCKTMCLIEVTGLEPVTAGFLGPSSFSELHFDKYELNNNSTAPRGLEPPLSGRQPDTFPDGNEANYKCVINTKESRGFEPLGLLYSPKTFPRSHHKPLGQLSSLRRGEKDLIFR